MDEDEGVAAMPSQGPRRRAPGELEAAILRALWDAGTPLTPTELQERAAADLAYNTVHTVLTRMCDKGLLYRTRIAGRPAYLPTHEPAEHEADRLHAVLNATSDHAALLRRFVAKLSPEDEAILEALLRNKPDEGATG
jgi:predicted transcriptional regulator